ncbi:MAG: hypothetical protein GY782_05190 [Gammaproteobacteria bacterium]|nr:hypothetical protein [Gammaproteobacteria bacterium]
MIDYTILQFQTMKENDGFPLSWQICYVCNTHEFKYFEVNYNRLKAVASIYAWKADYHAKASII